MHVLSPINNSIVCKNSIIPYNIIIICIVYACTPEHIIVRLFLLGFCIPGALTAPQQLPSLGPNPRTSLAHWEPLVPRLCSLRPGWDPPWKQQPLRRTGCVAAVVVAAARPGLALAPKHVNGALTPSWLCDSEV